MLNLNLDRENTMGATLLTPRYYTAGLIYNIMTQKYFLFKIV